MDEDFKEKFLLSMFRFRKTGLELPGKKDVNLTELFVLGSISKKAFIKGKTVNLSEIQEQFHITKGAISQMFTSLEKRGYIIRETDRTNRRRITVELTAEGTKTIDDAEKRVTTMLDILLDRLGEEKARQLVLLLDELLDITDELKELYEE
jgi:DNA-binding MarR family transcriptional regulator